jgi:hypothetical protein
MQVSHISELTFIFSIYRLNHILSVGVLNHNVSKRTFYALSYSRHAEMKHDLSLPAWLREELDDSHVILFPFTDGSVGDFGIRSFQQIADSFVIQIMHGGIGYNSRAADLENTLLWGFVGHDIYCS